FPGRNPPEGERGTDPELAQAIAAPRANIHRSPFRERGEDQTCMVRLQQPSRDRAIEVSRARAEHTELRIK
ncbi:MAG TPA: hypothetical protein VIM73_13985, partial [Polyangiaceae bacterium]